MAEAIRPLTFDEILDRAFSLYRENFATFYLTALVPHVPILLFWLVLPIVSGGSSDVFALAPMLILPYNFFAVVLLMGGLTDAAGDAHTGGVPHTGAALLTGLRRWFTVGVALFVGWFLIFWGFIFFIIPGLILLAMFFATVPAAVLERRGPFASLGRSRALSRGARMRVLGIMLVAWLITFVPTVAMASVAGVSTGMNVLLDPAAGGASQWLTAVIQACGILVSALTWPFQVLVTVLLYYDRRARTEAPDLEAALERLETNG